MTLDDLKDELEKDMPIKLTSLQSEAADNPILYGKWVRYLSEVKRDLLKADNELKRVVNDRYAFYTGRSDTDVCLDHYDKSELKYVLVADKEVMAAQTKVDLIGIMYDHCKLAIDSVKQRGYSIKSIVDQRMLESGK
ncbi:MAG: hypothetical protein [Caudoviricetes sp.]|nr:MAG: hypothetical protein [Caudoviricetes sp.]